MAQTPLAPLDPFAPAEPAQAGQRVSGLAVGAFITSLLCCIPGVGVVAAVLGIGALVSIARSEGRLGGRALAFLAIVLGTLGTMLIVGILVGASWVVGALQPYRATMSAIEAGDVAGARAHLVGTASAVSDARLAAFREEYRRAFGGFRRFPPGLGGCVRGWMAVGPGWSDVDHAQRAYPGGGFVPLGAEFDTGPGLVIFVMDDSGAASGLPGLKNIGIAGRGSGITWLVDPSGTPSPQP